MRRFLKSHATRLIEGVIVTFARFVCAPRVLLAAPLAVDRARVYVANHTSNADTILIWAALPPELRHVVRPVAAADYWLSSRLRAFVGRDVFRILPIERVAERRTTDPVAQMAAEVDAGWSLILFPEGKRNQGEAALLPLKAGIFHLVRARPALEVVPVWIDNLNGVLPKGEVLPVPLICTLNFGRPLRLRDAEGKDAFLARLRTALLDLAPRRPVIAAEAATDAEAGRSAGREAPDGA